MWPPTVYPWSSRWHILAALGGLAEFKKGRKLGEEHGRRIGEGVGSEGMGSKYDQNPFHEWMEFLREHSAQPVRLSIRKTSFSLRLKSSYSAVSQALPCLSQRG